MFRLPAPLENPLRLIGSGLGSGERLPVAACWQPGISRAACAAAEIAAGALFGLLVGDELTPEAPCGAD